MTVGLEGIMVIETASVLAGPLAGRLLADLGADVIHIERPPAAAMAGNATQQYRSRLQGVRGIQSGINYIEENTNCNKRSMTLDLGREPGRKILYRMLESADVFLSNFRPYEIRKFGMASDFLSGLNPRLVHANLTGYGKKGPDRDLPGYDFNTFWTRSGMMHFMLTPGMTPISTPNGLGDRVTAVVPAYGIMAALLIQERTGTWQAVDTSLLQAAIFVNANDAWAARLLPDSPGRMWKGKRSPMPCSIPTRYLSRPQ